MQKYLISLFVFIFIGIQAKSQDFTNYNHYSQNSYLYNPAGVCQDYKLFTYAISNNKWMGFNNAPRYLGLGGYVNLKGESAFGIKLNNYQGGSYNESELALSYGYKFQLFKNHWLSLGFSAKGLQQNIDLLNVNVYQFDDPTLESSYYKSSSVSFAFGMQYSYKDFQFQFAMPRILDVNSAFRESIISYTEYTFHVIPKEFNLTPGILVNHLNKGATWVDINLRGELKDELSLQITYRTNNNMVFLTSYNWNGIKLGYAYEMSVGPETNFSNGCHEIQLCFSRERKERRKKTIMF